jgi:ubiquinone/menaquinone biosynthesis C-methylase UbiE
MVSFMDADARTALEDLDYDTLYRVDDRASDRLHGQVKQFLGTLMPEQVASYLEVGAGTGLFTLAYLSETRPERALLTDVSAKMLEVCRERLASRSVEQHTAVSYALWDGGSPCFRDKSFDLVAGFSVLHHILDYAPVLRILRGALADGGRAIFLEPGVEFHRALIDFMSDVVESIPLREDWTEADRNTVGCWIGENHINVKFRGDSLALAFREDKHLFEIHSLRETAFRAGFGEVRIIPFGGTNEAWITLGVYVNQLALPEAAKSLLLDHCARRLPGQFAFLAPEDRAPSFLIVLDRDAPDSGAAMSVGSATLPEMQFIHPHPFFRFSVDVAAEFSGDDAERVCVSADGWLLGDADVREIRIEGGGSARFPLGAVRFDVERAFNADGSYPKQRAMCCGIMRVPSQSLRLEARSQLRVVVVTMAGARFELGWITPGEAGYRFQHLAGVHLPAADASGEPGDGGQPSNQGTGCSWRETRSVCSTCDDEWPPRQRTDGTPD